MSEISARQKGKLVLDVFRAIEQREDEKFRELLDPIFEIRWPPSLPCGGRGASTWSQTWEPLQPTEAERRMDPRVVAENDDEVVVLWQQRGLSPSGERFKGEVLGLYQARNGKLTRAQMFYFDVVAVVRFLERTKQFPAL